GRVSRAAVESAHVTHGPLGIPRTKLPTKGGGGTDTREEAQTTGRERAGTAQRRPEGAHVAHAVQYQRSCGTWRRVDGVVIEVGTLQADVELPERELRQFVIGCKVDALHIDPAQ